MNKKRVLVLDTSALIAGYDPSGIEGEHYTVKEIIHEIKDSIIRIRVQAALDSGDLKVKRPLKIFREKVVESANDLGNLDTLSSADISILALALQFKEFNKNFTLISGDYSVQNVAKQLCIKYVPFSTIGISHMILWITYCPGCRLTFKKTPQRGVCPICGTLVKKKPLKKSEIKN